MKPVILIVDDSSIDQQVAAGLLRKQTQFDVEFAWDGDDALARLSRSRIDVVVTDLVMPGKDGLELILEMRRQYPQTPVAMMTACGNEDIAAEALVQGAASYVPKSQLAQRLVPTVTRLVNRAIIDRCRNLSATHLQAGVLQYEFGNDPFLIESIVNGVHRTMTSMRIGHATDRIRACTALEEALSNAILHGNLEISESQLADIRRSGDRHALNRVIEMRLRQPKYRERRVRLAVDLHRDYAKFVVRDHGIGFNANWRGAADLQECFDHGKDRGLTLMHALVDDLHFNDEGNEVSLAKASPSLQSSGA